jgi:hypothetical protein
MKAEIFQDYETANHWIKNNGWDVDHIDIQYYEKPTTGIKEYNKFSIIVYYRDAKRGKQIYKELIKVKIKTLGVN